MATPMIVTDRNSSNGGGGGGGGGVQSASSPTNKLSFLKNEPLKFFGQFCYTSYKVKWASDVVARTNYCKLSLCMQLITNTVNSKSGPLNKTTRIIRSPFQCRNYSYRLSSPTKLKKTDVTGCGYT